MTAPEYVSVRRPADAPFGVLPGDLTAEEPRGYDLDLIRSLTTEGLVMPIAVEPLADGQFRVVDGQKRMAAVRMLMRMNKVVFDRARGLLGPARQVFGLLRCRLRASSPPNVQAVGLPTILTVPRLSIQGARHRNGGPPKPSARPRP